MTDLWGILKTVYVNPTACFIRENIVIWGMKQKEKLDIAHNNDELEQKLADYAPKIQNFSKKLMPLFWINMHRPD